MSNRSGPCDINNGDDDDVIVVEVISKKKPVTWVSSSFDSFGSEPFLSQKSLKTPKNVGHVKTGQSAGKKPSGVQTSLFSFTPESHSRKRPREPVHRFSSQVQSQTQSSPKRAQNTDLWSEKYKPLTRGELAVHKKKVDEIAEWLKLKTENVTKHATPILLLTGPPGAGKTACVQVLCTELGLTVQEWSSSSEQAADLWSSEDRSERSKVDVYTSQSQSSVFYNFLLRANKYHALELISSTSENDKHSAVIPSHVKNNTRGSGNVIVVEDIPNVFFRDTSQFHDILRKYVRIGHCPLVFIMSESNNNSSSIQKLFPKDLQQQLRITHIGVNPVAPTMLVKVLNRVVGKEAGQGKFMLPPTSVIETVAMSSSGDVRSALNTLQFACRKDTNDLGALSQATSRSSLKKQGSGPRLKYSTSRKPAGEDSQSDRGTSVLGVKDKSVFLFHAVGKILYFKRDDPKSQPELPSLPCHLQQHERDPLHFDPEDVAHQSHLSGDYFVSFLHENYVDFLSSVEDLERATKYFSDADYLSSLWMGREELQQYSVSVASRGFIHSNSEYSRHDSSRKNQGWRPLHKSQWFNASRQAAANVLSARQLFKGYHWEPEVLCTEILPFINLTNPTLHDTGQITFVQEMTQFSQAKEFFRPNRERLDERDVVEEYVDENDNVPATQGHTRHDPNVHTTQSQHAPDNLGSVEECDEDEATIPSSQRNLKRLTSEDEFVIEEFDDDDF